MTIRRRKRSPPPCRGFVSLVGAGPGDPDLLTHRAIERLRAADLVLHDGLVPRPILRLATAAELVSVSKRVGGKTLTQDAINARMIDGARRGHFVVRLKSGDPFVLGRGGEEVLALRSAGVPFDVVPGVSSATAAPALAGIPVTHRGVASGFVVISGHAVEAWLPLVDALPPAAATVVVLMGLGQRTAIAERLLARGWRRDTPAAIVVSASRPNQQVWTGTLDTLCKDIDAIGDRRDQPGVIVVGDVVALAVENGAADRYKLQEHTWQPMTTPRL